MKTLKDYIMCICILHNMLIENDVPILPELDVERTEDFDTVSRVTEFSTQYAKSREIRNGIAKYLSLLPNHSLNEYTPTI